MKSIYKNIVLLFTFLMVSLNVNAQEEKLPTYFSNQTSTISSLAPTLQSFNDLQVNAKNQNTARTNTNSSLVYLKQIGNSNEISVLNNTGSTQAVFQIGNQNQFLYRDRVSDPTINIGVVQENDKNLLSINGSASYLNNMIIRQRGGSELIINNY